MRGSQGRGRGCGRPHHYYERSLLSILGERASTRIRVFFIGLPGHCFVCSKTGLVAVECADAGNSSSEVASR